MAMTVDYYPTGTALLHTLDNIYCFSDERKPVLLVSLDTAFNIIDHSTLLRRLQASFGVSGSALVWLQSYLVDRRQFISAGQASSPHTKCHTGVPQGSVLGPILFSCYVSPISSFGVAIA